MTKSKAVKALKDKQEPEIKEKKKYNYTVKTGRPTEYNPVRHPKIIMVMASKGSTEAEIAEALGISGGRFNDWKKKHLEVSEALTFNIDVLNSEIEGTAWQEANGYHIKEPTYDIEGNQTGYQDKWIKPNTVILKLLLAHRLNIREIPLPDNDKSNKSNIPVEIQENDNKL